MKIAVRYIGVQIDEDGHIAGHDAGATPVRRLLRVSPGSQVIGLQPHRCDGFEVVPIEMVNGNNTVIINMEFGDAIDGLTTKAIADDARIAWVNLGFRIEHVQPRREPEVPVALYPVIYLSERKRPQLFIDVVERVAKRTPIQVEARLHETHLIREMAMNPSRRKWAWVGPLTATREGYWQALSRTTAFLATSTDESHGLEYVEALAAGAVAPSRTSRGRARFCRSTTPSSIRQAAKPRNCCIGRSLTPLTADANSMRSLMVTSRVGCRCATATTSSTRPSSSA